MSDAIREAGDGVRLTLHIQPGASHSGFAGRHGDAIKLRIASRPVDGAANAELTRFLAEYLGVSRAAVAIVAGAHSRRKVVHVAGLAAAKVRARLGREIAL